MPVLLCRLRTATHWEEGSDSVSPSGSSPHSGCRPSLTSLHAFFHLSVFPSLSLPSGSSCPALALSLFPSESRPSCRISWASIDSTIDAREEGLSADVAWFSPPSTVLDSYPGDSVGPTLPPCFGLPCVWSRSLSCLRAVPQACSLPPCARRARRHNINNIGHPCPSIPPPPLSQTDSRQERGKRRWEPR